MFARRSRALSSRKPDHKPVDLPFELWAHIASFLDRDETDKLISLNRFFYNYVLDARYDRVFIWEAVDRRKGLIFKSLGISSNAARVHTMILTSFPPARSWIETAKKKFRSKPRAPLQEAKILSMDSMTNLRHLTLLGPFLPGCAILAALTLPPSLKTLVLRVPVSSFPAIASSLPLDTSPRLSELSLELKCECCIERRCHISREELISKTLPVLSLFSLTVETLKLRLRDVSSCVLHPATFCKHLQTLTFFQLRELGIVLDTYPRPSPLATEHIRSFISTSTPNLTDLTLTAYPSALLIDALPARDLGHALRPPQLQYLRLRLPFGRIMAALSLYGILPGIEGFSVDELSTFIRSQRSSLVQLDLSTVSLRHSQLTALLELFQGQSAPLLSLQFTIWRLEPRVFECIASSLPQLLVLGIDYEDVQPNNGADPHSDSRTRITQFIDELNDLCFVDWGLDCINLIPLHPSPDFHLEETLLKVFPAVKTIYEGPKGGFTAWCTARGDIH